MNRSLWAVLIGTFTLRFSTGLTGLTLTFYLNELGVHHRFLDTLFHVGEGRPIGDIGFAIIAALFYVGELVLSPVFGVISDRLGHHRVMQYGPVFGIIAVVATWATTNLPIIGATRLLEGSATAASVPSILGYIAVVTAADEGLRGRASARFEAATLGGLLAGFGVAGFLWTAVGPEAFLVNAVIYAISLAIYRFWVDPALDPTGRPKDATAAGRFDFGRYRRVLGGTHALLLAPTWIAVNAVIGLYTTQTIRQLTLRTDSRFPDQLLMGGFDPVEISVGLVLGGILFFAGLVYWGNRFKTTRRTTIILYGIGGGLLVVAGAVALNHSGGLGVLPRIGVALPLIVGVFVLAGATPAAIGLLADVTEAYPDDRGAVMGLYSVFLALGQITGALIGGVAANALGLDGIFGASVALLLVAIVPLSRLRAYEHFIGPDQVGTAG